MRNPTRDRVEVRQGRICPFLSIGKYCYSVLPSTLPGNINTCQGLKFNVLKTYSSSYTIQINDKEVTETK